MTTSFVFNKCILCLENPVDSLEHIIPESIGGRLKYEIFCKRCNSTLGTDLISKVKADPSIRMAVLHLKDEIPEIFESVENGQMYVGRDKNDNRIPIQYKDGKAKVKSFKKQDGSLIYDTQDAPRHFKKMMKMDGIASDVIDTKIDLLEGLGNNIIIPLTENISVVKWSFDEDSITPLLDGPFIDDRVIVSIVYGFLSLVLGNSVYDARLEFVRDFIKYGARSDVIVVEHLTSNLYAPLHKICLGLKNNETVVTIIFFRWLVFKVRFKNLILRCPEYVYSQDLKNKKSAIAKSIEEAKRGNYYLY